MDNVLQNKYNRVVNSINEYIKKRNKIYNRKGKFKNPIAVYASLKYNENIEHFNLAECQNWVIEKFNLLEPIKEKQIQSKRKSFVKYTDYGDFLASKYWNDIKILIHKRDGYKCVKCGSIAELHVHHIIYKNHFNEMNHLEDLETLCNECHKTVHSIDEKELINQHLNSI